MRIETRCQAAEKELEELRRDYKKITDEHVRLNRDNSDYKDQLKTLNENLKRQTELCTAREREANSLSQENKTLRSLMDSFKQDAANLKENQNSIIGNLRKQLDETNEIIETLKETKHREFKKLREKCDEEIRRETDKYQFEYDKLRDEIQMFQRKLNQEESLNKQLGQLNEKMVSNMGELRNQYKIEMNEERIDILAGVQSQFQVQRATTTDDEILDRKKAIIELEREQREVQRDIKSLMKFEPASRILTEDPALADRVSQ